ncbi:MAG: outer membrane lipoprotein carrier protein LolA [Deltaproteobacteria bacterium]|nr:outer membrane lipoprotein carrier protein LolA [Deltaproteobacteria bacterium]
MKPNLSNFRARRDKRHPGGAATLLAAALFLLLGAAGATANGARAETDAPAVPRDAAAPGRPAALDALVKGLQARYERLEDFKARFEQQSRLEAAGSAQIARGEVFFQKPGRMRWNYETPEPQQILISEGKLTQYVPADKQIVVQGLDTNRVEYAFLTGLGELENEFNIRWAEPRRRPDDPLEYIELTPRDADASFARLVLGVETRGHRILATEVKDFLGNVTSLRFEKLQDNVGLGADVFAINKPAGVDVIDMTDGWTTP